MFNQHSGMHQHIFRDIPPSASDSIAALKARNLEEMLVGCKPSVRADARNLHSWMILGGLGSHDLSAMRDILGMPKRCLSSTRSDDGNGAGAWWTAQFEYEGFTTFFEVSPEPVR
jgi:hypothetical protein